MNFKRITAFLLAAIMIFSMCVFAEETVTTTDEKAGETLLISPAPQNVQNEQTEVAATEQTTVPAISFTDVPETAPYYDEVKKLVENGVIKGYGDGTFKPDNGVTRAEMCKMVNLTLGIVDIEGAMGFTDVTSKNWFYLYALAAQKNGYVVGYEDGSFRGSKLITREEVCTILNRLLKPMNLGTPVTITDKVSGWAKPHVEVIVQNFLMPLEENNTFRATEVIKRHELATVLSNLVIGPVKEIHGNVRFFVGDVQYGETQSVPVGSVPTVPEDPKTDDVTMMFDGWREKGTEDVVDVKSMIVTKDVDYEAVFVKKTYTVNFYSRGALYETKAVEHSAFASVTAEPSVKGFTFIGWALTDGGNVVDLKKTAITADTNFYAIFEKGESAGGGPGGGGPGGGGPTGGSNTSDKDDDKDDDTTDEGGDSGKDPGNDPGNDPEADPEEKPEDKEPVFYEVIFMVNGKSYQEQSVEEGLSPAVPEEPSLEEHTFLGWSYSENGGSLINVLGIKVQAKVVLYAVFEKNDVEEEKPVYHSVKFYVNGSLHDEQLVLSGANISAVSDPEVSGYDFLGWSNTENGKVIDDITSLTVDADVKLYAVLKAQPKKYTVKFVVNGEEYDKQTVTEGEYAEEPDEPEVDGFTFEGWTKTEGSSKKDSVSATKISGNTTFYAILERIPDPEPVYCTVTFYSNGSVVKETEILSGTTPSVPKNPTLKHHEFLGWAKEEDGKVVDVSKIAITDDTEYYAVFEALYYWVYFYVDNKVYYKEEVLGGETASTPDDPEVSGGVFLGWTDVKGGDESDIVDVSDTNIEYDGVCFYAVFQEDVNDPDLIQALKDGKSQIGKLRVSGVQKQARDLVVETISNILSDAEDGIYIDKSYVKEEYESEIDEVKDLINNEMDSNTRTNFLNNIKNNVKQNVRDFLIEYFDINTDNI